MAKKPSIGATIGLDGEKEFRQAISGINSDYRVLQSEMKKVSAEFADNSNSVEALSAKNEILNKQLETQKTKVDTLRAALENSVKQYGENDTRTDKWKISLNNAEAELSNLTKEVASNKEAMGKAASGTSEAAKSVKELGDEADKANDKFKKSASEGLKDLAIGVTAAAAGMSAMVMKSAENADQIQTNAEVYGMTAERIQELTYVGTKLDVELDTMTKSQQLLTKNMYLAKDGTGAQAEAFKELGISVRDEVTGELRDSKVVMGEAIDALGKMTNETQRDALAQKVFGKSAMELNPLIKAGSDEIARLTEEARNTGAVMSNEAVEGLDSFGDSVEAAKLSIQGMLGEALAPLTPKLEEMTTKISEVDLSHITDGMGWIIDNSGTIIGGIGGIAAGMAVFKAGSAIQMGMDLAAKAWKAYKASTEGATVAQYALNVAQNMSPVGLLATAVGLLTAGIIAYKLSVGDAESETDKMIDKLEETAKSSEELNNTIQDGIQAREENRKSIEDESGAAKILSDKLYDLADKENKTNAEKAQMASLIDELNKSIPDLNLVIDETTGVLNKQRGEVDNLIEANLKLAKVEAAKEDLAQIAKDQYNAEKDLVELTEARRTALENAQKAEEKLNNAVGQADINKARKEYKEAQGALEDLDEQILATTATVRSLGNEWDSTSEYIGNNSGIDATAESLDTLETSSDKATKSIISFSAAISGTKNELNDVYEEGLQETLDNSLSRIEDYYDKRDDKLEKSLDKEKGAIDKSYEDSVKALKNSSEKEMKILDEAHAEKLKLINDEYTEKMKLVDENRYNELKAVQDQIDGINAQNDADAAAAEEKADSQKRSELEQKVSSAANAEELAQAQQDLADFEEELRVKKIQKERELQIETLEAQKETINQSYDAKIESLKSEQDAKTTELNDEYAADQENIKKKYELKQQELEDEKELIDAAFEEKSANSKKFLQDEKDKAIASAKDTYDKDLKEFKKNNSYKLSAYKQFSADVKAEFDTLSTDLAEKMKTAGANAAKGFSSGWKDEKPSPEDTVGGSMQSVIRKTKNTLEIQSPSKVFMRDGAFSARGFGIGFTDEMKNVTRDINNSMPTSLNLSGSVKTSGGIDTSTYNAFASVVSDLLIPVLKTVGIKVEIEANENGLFKAVRTEATKFYEQTGLQPFPT